MESAHSSAFSGIFFNGVHWVHRDTLGLCRIFSMPSETCTHVTKRSISASKTKRFVPWLQPIFGESALKDMSIVDCSDRLTLDMSRFGAFISTFASPV